MAGQLQVACSYLCTYFLSFLMESKADHTAQHHLHWHWSKLCVWTHTVSCFEARKCSCVRLLYVFLLCVCCCVLVKTVTLGCVGPGIVMMYRAAMVGYAILAYVEYNQELRRAAAVVYQRLQQQGGIGL